MIFIITIRGDYDFSHQPIISLGKVIGKSESVYSDGATTPVGNAPEFKLNVIVYGATHCSTDVEPAGDVVPSGHGEHHGLPALLNC